MGRVPWGGQDSDMSCEANDGHDDDYYYYQPLIKQGDQSNYDINLCFAERCWGWYKKFPFMSHYREMFYNLNINYPIIGIGLKS